MSFRPVVEGIKSIESGGPGQSHKVQTYASTPKLLWVAASLLGSWMSIVISGFISNGRCTNTDNDDSFCARPHVRRIHLVEPGLVRGDGRVPTERDP